jgi:putative DNA primase/helicase
MTFVDTRRLMAEERRGGTPDMGDPFTEDALALRFTEQHQHELRYVAARSTWYKWDGARWKPEKTLLAFNLARECCRSAAKEYGNEKPPAGITSAKTISAIEKLAKADRRFAASNDVWDADPWLLNTPAGMVDLHTGKLLRHDPAKLMTKITAVAPGRECKTPVWNAFLERIMDGDAELIAYLQRVAGYSLTGSTREEQMWFCYGTGQNGKSKFIEAISGCMGDYHTSAPEEIFTITRNDQHPTGVASLQGARLVTGTEVEQGRAWNETKIKKLTGGDEVPARFMRQDYFRYRPTYKIMLSGNHKPGLRHVDIAIRRRLNLVPFAVTIPPKERDDLLPEKLNAEWPGILAWMIEGCLEWQRIGLAAPKAVADATVEYFAAEDAIGNWIEDELDRDKAAFETTTDLFVAWSNYAKANGEPAGGVKSFRETLLTGRGLTPDRTKFGRGFRGARLKSRYGGGTT